MSHAFNHLQVKVKMSKEGFLKNNRGINDGQDLPPDFMGAIYDRIVYNEIKMKDDTLQGTCAVPVNSLMWQLLL